VASLEIDPACLFKSIHPFNYHWTSVFRVKRCKYRPWASPSLFTLPFAQCRR